MWKRTGPMISPRCEIWAAQKMRGNCANIRKTWFPYVTTKASGCSENIRLPNLLHLSVYSVVLAYILCDCMFEYALMQKWRRITFYKNECTVGCNKLDCTSFWAHLCVYRIPCTANVEQCRWLTSTQLLGRTYYTTLTVQHYEKNLFLIRTNDHKLRFLVFRCVGVRVHADLINKTPVTTLYVHSEYIKRNK